MTDAAPGSVSTPESAETSAELSRKHVRGSTLLLAGRLGSLVLTMATQVVIVRALSKTEFGAFAFALAITSACRSVLSLGQGKSLSRHLAIHDERGERHLMFGTAALAIGTILISSMILIATVLVFSDSLAGSVLEEPSARNIIAILIFLAPLEALDEVLVSWFAVFSKPTWIFFRRYLLSPGLRLGIVVTVVLTDGSPLHIAIGYLATTVLGQLLYITLLVSLLRQHNLLGGLRLRSLSLPFRSVFSFSLPLLSNELVYLCTHTGSVMLLAHYHGASEVAHYRAVFPAARLNQLILITFTTLYLPTAARLFARGVTADLRRTYWHTAVFVAVFSFPVFALTVPFAEATTTTLFGARYAESASILALLSAGYYFSVCLGFNAHTLQVIGKVRYLLWVNLFCAALNVTLAVLLVPRYGAVGVGVSAGSMLVAQNLLNQWAIRRHLGTGWIARGYIRPYVVIAAVALVLGVVNWVARPGIWVALGASAAGSLVVFTLSRRALALRESFPELARVPILRRIVG